ncbi:hypothetical protein SLNWT_2792 [Streptomyces albus]|uniref:Uncharacterized protein n=1 Tax=Streptomyces albus (strain ATCC 21838 / DSM 41398 / FERM P-419 / JCM 4703 / NBRC 107858) TaxID=1081613 RepID=A0A0B5EL99_STRA4|nr:hypothetical protein SLNWT_2792 [Streptomyces albus]AOU77479.1 hypothetical protein SLNHY_2788 [Streptomyces albus]AYN33252.1 hypothetical protein DUI70_2751 [Streptomyces albus]
MDRHGQYPTGCKTVLRSRVPRARPYGRGFTPRRAPGRKWFSRSAPVLGQWCRPASGPPESARTAGTSGTSGRKRRTDRGAEHRDRRLGLPFRR